MRENSGLARDRHHLSGKAALSTIRFTAGSRRCNQWPVLSNLNPSRASVRACPPTRSSRSSSTQGVRRCAAVEMPVRPPPRITTGDPAASTVGAARPFAWEGRLSASVDSDRCWLNMETDGLGDGPRLVIAPAPPSVAASAQRARRGLDQAHRKRLRGGLPLALSMRYLATAFERLRLGTVPVTAARVPRPPAKTVSLTFVGHATVMITTPATRVIVDPLLENSLYGIRRAKSAGVAEPDLDDVDLVLVTHAHRDHLSRASLARLPGSAPVVVPPHCERLVRRVGLLNVVELHPAAPTPWAIWKSSPYRCAIRVPADSATTRGGGPAATSSAHPMRASTWPGTPATSPVSPRSARGFAPTWPCCRSPGTNRRPSVKSTSPLSTPSTPSRTSARASSSPPPTAPSPSAMNHWTRHSTCLQQIARERGLAQGGPSPTANAREARRVAVLDHGETVHFRRSG